MTNLFDPKFKAATQQGGTLYKWDAGTGQKYTVGAQFGGTFLGSHVWEDADGKSVTAYDFAACQIDGVVKPETEVFTFNETAVLNSIMGKVRPGQRMGIRYEGKGNAKPGMSQPHVFTPFVDPSNIDTEYTRFLTASVASQPVGATPVAAAPAAAPFLGAQPVAAAPAAEPFATKGEILAILAGKLGVATEEGAGPTIKGLTQLDFVEANYSAIKQKLVAQFGA